MLIQFKCWFVSLRLNFNRQIKVMFCSPSCCKDQKAVLLLLIRCWLLLPCRVLCFSMFCCAVLCVLSIFAMILMGKIELVTLLCLFVWCLVVVIVLWLFLAMPWVGLKCVIVVFPSHTYLIFQWKRFDVIEQTIPDFLFSLLESLPFYPKLWVFLYVLCNTFVTVLEWTSFQAL